jgi:glycosyltransferase 2 family protein
VKRLRAVHRTRYGPAVLATVVTVVFGYLSVRNVDFDELGSSLRESNYWSLAPAFALLALAFVIRTLRWRVLFSPDSRPAFWPATQALLVGQFFNNVLPLRAGDAARIVALHSLGGRSRVETAATVVIERYFDVLALLVLLFAALAWFPEVTWIRAAGILAVVLTLALVAAVVVLRVYGERPLRFALRPLARLPFLFPERIEAAVRNLMEGLIGLRSVRVGLVAFFWTLVSWLVLAACFWLVLLGFDLDLPASAGLLAVIAGGLSLIVPSAPAAVGVFEAATIVALGAYGVPQTHALSYALVVHALNVLPFVVAGLLVLNLQRGVLRSSRSGKRHGDGIVQHGRGLEPPGTRSDAGGNRDRTGDDQDDVAEPADRHLHVDELRELR